MKLTSLFSIIAAANAVSRLCEHRNSIRSPRDTGGLNPTLVQQTHLSPVCTQTLGLADLIQGMGQVFLVG